jgi:D-tyrosyl-tRNA(Tyr) deacylase
MLVVIQRVSTASVAVENQIVGSIGIGLLVLVGIEPTDTDGDAEWLAKKIVQLRIFSDTNGVPNYAVHEIGGDILLISQFTLFASTKKGNRPSYLRAAKPDIAVPLYEKFIILLEKESGKKIQTGIFGADMKVSLCNDGPITIIMDSQNKV